MIPRLKAVRGASKVVFSGSAQRQQCDLWRDADAHRKAECSESAVHVERGLLRAIARRLGVRVTVHRQIVEPGHERRNQSRRTDAVIHDLEFYLSAVGVSGEAEF